MASCHKSHVFVNFYIQLHGYETLHGGKKNSNIKKINFFKIFWKGVKKEPVSTCSPNKNIGASWNNWWGRLSQIWLFNNDECDYENRCKDILGKLPTFHILLVKL